MISSYSTASVEETVDDTMCSDLCGYQPNNTAVATVLGRSIDTDPIYCESAVEYCWMINMTAVRAFCGKTCGCGNALPSFSGFFRSHDYGCPGGCDVDHTISLQNISCEDANIPTMVPNEVWTKYVYGMQSYVFSFDGYSDRISQVLVQYYTIIGINRHRLEDVHAFVTGNGFWNSLANYHYFFADGVPDPNGKTGCAFLTSNIFSILLDIDVCSTSDVYADLKSVCPISCSCGIYPAECPTTCF